MTQEQDARMPRALPQPSTQDRLAAFGSGWFVIVMGLGGVVNVVAALWGDQGVMAPWVQAGVWANSAIFAILFGLWFSRWFLAPAAMWRELTHPASGHFFALVPIALAILGMNWLDMRAVFTPHTISVIMNTLWIVSIALGLLFSVVITDALIRREGLEAEHVTFAWLIGSVATALFPLLGDEIVGLQYRAFPAWAAFVNLLDIAYFGIGFFLFLFLTAYLFGRYFNAAQPPSHFSPTSWLLLGAAAVLSLAAWGVAESSLRVGLSVPSGVALPVAFMLWGLAGWSFLVGFVMVLRVWFAGELRFTLIWWAFVFPLSAYVLDTRFVAQAAHAAWLYAFADIFVVLLAVFFAVVLAETFASLLTGRLWRTS